MKLYNSGKTSSLFFAGAFILLSFVCCTKEYSQEHKNASPFAQGSLKDTSGNCLNVSAAGSFYKGTTPNAGSNFVKVKVHVTWPGTYTISTDVQNGFRFADSGYFNRRGDTTIHLEPIGMPSLSGSAFFTIRFNADACYLFVDVQ